MEKLEIHVISHRPVKPDLNSISRIDAIFLYITTNKIEMMITERWIALWAIPKATGRCYMGPVKHVLHFYTGSSLINQCANVLLNHLVTSERHRAAQTSPCCALQPSSWHEFATRAARTTPCCALQPSPRRHHYLLLFIYLFIFIYIYI